MHHLSARHLLIVSLLLAAGLRAETRFVEGEVIVTFKANTTLDGAKAALKKKSLTFAKHFDRLSEKRKKPTGLVQNKDQTTAKLMEDLKADPTVESVEPNYIRWVKSTPNDTRFAELWALRNSGQSVDGVSGTAGADISYDEAWQYARTSGARPVVAVVDTGVDYTHADLAANIWRNPGETAGNSVDDDGNGYVDDVVGYDFSSSDSDPFDSGEHGTHVAGTIAAIGNNRTGVIGVMDKAQIVALKVSSDGNSITTSAVIAALQYATALKNAGVNLVAINASYGGGGFSTAESAAIQAAGNAGIILVAAAGNESANNDAEVTYPASYRLSNMIVVAASDQNDQLASYSNYGATSVNLAAPGTNILSLEPGTTSFQSGSTTYTSNEITFAGRTAGVSGNLIDCGIGNTSDFPSSVNGHIALIQRGTLTFATKIANAKAAGAKAAIIYNNAPGNFLGTVSAPGDWIPARSISQADGVALKASLPRTAAIVVSAPYQVLDGTSMATPHVAGAVAFAAMCFPAEAVAARRARILSAVDLKSTLTSKVATGGRLNLMSVITGGASGSIPWPHLTSAATLPSGAVGTDYSQTLNASGGSAPYHFTLTGGALPNGLNLVSTGVIEGVPTVAGFSTFTVQVGDASGEGLSQTFVLNIAEAPPLIVTDADLGDTAVGEDFSIALEGSQGTAPYVWSLASGALPLGLQLSTAGLLSGVPMAAGDFEFGIRLTDDEGIAVTRSFHLSVTASAIIASTSAVLPGAVLGVPYHQTLSAEGGVAPYTWTIVSGALPSGVSLQSNGEISGTPTTTGSYVVDVRMTDANGEVGAERFWLGSTSTYVRPVLDAVSLPAAAIGASYSSQVTAQNYPSTFTATGLPKGLTCAKSTGLISGRPTQTGTFSVVVVAGNSGGSSAPVIAPLTVLAVDLGRVGNFTGLVARDAAVNNQLGSKLSLTTTSRGTFSAKLTTGVTSKSATGYLNASSPHVVVVISGAVLSLDLNADTFALSGTHGGATVSGWRSIWSNKILPATTRTGFYSAALDLADSADDGRADIPQGSGFLSGTVSLSGVAALTGKTSDGQSVTQIGPLGPNGEVSIYQSLHSGKGSLAGVIQVQQDAVSAPTENTLSGSLTWLRPSLTSRTYGAGFGPLNLTAKGGYLGTTATSRIILGLPETGNATLTFTDGGLASATLDPDLTFIYNSNHSITMPTFVSGTNPTKATLSINKNTGAIGGTFTLVDGSVVRKTSFRGVIVRSKTSTQKAAGHFLLPQIPSTGETIKTSPILSGGVQISQ